MTFLTRKKHDTLFYGWPVLLVGTLITIAFSFYAYINVINENTLRYQFESDEILKQIQYKMNQYDELLLHTRSFFVSSPHVGRKDFGKYIQNLDIKNRHPEIQAIGFGVRVKNSELNSFIKSVRKEVPDYNIWPESTAEEYYPVVYIEPYDEQNKRVLGFNSISEEKRKEAIHQAITTGRTSITGKIYLVQDDIKVPHPGILLYAPYVNSKPEYLYVAFRSETLFRKIFHGKELPLDVEIFDGKVVDQNALIYDYDHVFHGNDKYSFGKSLELYGKEFLFMFHPTSISKNRSHYKAPCIVFIIGMIFTVLIFRLFGITKKSQIELTDALESRDEFISIASHELKTPLTAIKLHTQMVKRNASKISNPEDRKRIYDEHIEHTGILSQRLERLVDDMLDISRIKTGRLTIFKELVDMNEIVNEVIVRLRDQFKVIPDATPVINYGLGTTGIWDRHRIDQVVTNLMTNAIKYGEGKKIEVTTSSTPTTVLIKVKDYGIGIPNEFHQKIFQRFERAGFNNKGISGLGLGLYITHQIVQIHGGKILVESTLGEGSTFTVELPKTS